MTTIVAVKGMLNWYLSLPANQDHDLTNLEWIMINQALVLGARLDLLVTPLLRDILDLQHTHRQIILRLESAVRAQADEQDVFKTFLARCQKLQRWWLANRERSGRIMEPSVSTNPIGSTAGMDEVTVTMTAEPPLAFQGFNWEDLQFDPGMGEWSIEG